MKKLYCGNMDFIFLNCLRIANVSKLGWMLATWMKQKTFILEQKGYGTWIEYNDDRINRECFYKKSDAKNTTNAIAHLASKNIISYDFDTRKIKINCNPMIWDVTPEQHDLIKNEVDNKNLYYE
jgi:hypothetical protein